MTTLDPLALSGNKAKGKRPHFLQEPDVERLMNIVMALAGELAVTRERLDTVERLLAAGGTLDRADIEAYAPTSSDAAERGAWQQEFIARILRVVQQDAEALEAADDIASEDVAVELEGA